MAEEGVLAQALREPALLDQLQGLAGKDFSVPLLGRVLDQLVQRHSKGLEVSIGALTDLTEEEIAMLESMLSRLKGQSAKWMEADT